MTRYRATLAYDGAAYAGFQKQADGIRTIQGEIERVLAVILRQPTTVLGAGRTDAGVHATGQVIAFDADWSHSDQALLRAINASLPVDIALQDIRQHPGFHPRYDALSRTYRYTIAIHDVRQPLLNGRAWQMQRTVDFKVMQQAAECLIGEHDFAAFGNPPHGTNTIREIFASSWDVEQRDRGLLGEYHIEGTAFLHHMVRRIVGVIVAVGSGQITVQQFIRIFESRDLSQSRWLAPPHGLVLEAVSYPPPNEERSQ